MRRGGNNHPRSHEQRNGIGRRVARRSRRCGGDKPTTTRLPCDKTEEGETILYLISTYSRKRTLSRVSKFLLCRLPHGLWHCCGPLNLQ
jgi:hypothetical protein